MAKKRKQTYSKYKSFMLHGKYPVQAVLIYSISSFLVGFVIGMYLKPYLVGAILASAGSGY